MLRVDSLLRIHSKFNSTRHFHTGINPRGHSCGIVGLPNVGKSLLFNALLGRELARSENFPFCTINPNVSTTYYPDPNLIQLAKIVKPRKVTPVDIEFKDIAGLVQGASDGEGLGNQFLEHIRGVHVLIHVVRCFELEMVSHVMNTLDPIRDVEIIENELIQKDIQTLENLKRGKKSNKNSKYDPMACTRLASTAHEVLQKGSTLSSLGIHESHPDYEMLSSFHLLSSKPVLYVANVDESSAGKGNEYSEKLKAWVQERKGHFVMGSAQLEFEVWLILQLAIIEDKESKNELMQGYGLEQPAIEKIILKSFELLGLQMFYTIGKKEVRGWPVPKGSTARVCAGKIHTDFIQGFIKAERWNVYDFINTKGVGFKKDNKGADYIFQDGDCFEFKVRC